MQIVTLPAPSQDGITRDNVTVRVDAVVYYRVVDPVRVRSTCRTTAEVMAEHPAALQLRLLQTVVEVAAEKNSTLVLPFPVELLRFLERSTPAEPADTRAATLDISTLEAGPDADEDVAADAATAPEPTSAISTPA